MQIGSPPLHPVVVNWITPEKLFYQDWEFWLVLFTLALAVVTGWLAYETRGLRVDSAQAIKAAEKSAESAAADVAIAQQQFEATIQPLVSIKITDVKPGPTASRVTIVLRNVGSHPVRVIRTLVKVPELHGHKISDHVLRDTEHLILLADWNSPRYIDISHGNVPLTSEELDLTKPSWLNSIELIIECSDMSYSAHRTFSYTGTTGLCEVPKQKLKQSTSIH